MSNTYADELIERRAADDAVVARPLADRIAYLVGMDILEDAPNRFADKGFDEYLGLKRRATVLRIKCAVLRSEANCHREQLADRIMRSISNDGGMTALETAHDARLMALAA